MANPIPPGWRTMWSTMSRIGRHDHDDDEEGHQQEQKKQHPRHYRHPVVFDTMVDENWHSHRPSTGSSGSVQQKTEDDELPKQYTIHSQHQTWTKRVKTFLQHARTIENDDDALCWCE